MTDCCRTAYEDAADRQFSARKVAQEVASLGRKGYVIPAHTILISPKVSGMIEKYFIEEDGIFRPVPSLQNRVSSWSVVNLLSPADVSALAGSAVIFCRNAFIYFSHESVRRVVDMFADRMPTPGYLFIGAAESLVHVTNRFMLEDLGRAFVYVKR